MQEGSSFTRPFCSSTQAKAKIDSLVQESRYSSNSNLITLLEWDEGRVDPSEPDQKCPICSIGFLRLYLYPSTNASNGNETKFCNHPMCKYPMDIQNPVDADARPNEVEHRMQRAINLAMYFECAVSYQDAVMAAAPTFSGTLYKLKNPKLTENKNLQGNFNRVGSTEGILPDRRLYQYTGNVLSEEIRLSKHNPMQDAATQTDIDYIPDLITEAVSWNRSVNCSICKNSEELLRQQEDLRGGTPNAEAAVIRTSSMSCAESPVANIMPNSLESKELQRSSVVENVPRRSKRIRESHVCAYYGHCRKRSPPHDANNQDIRSSVSQLEVLQPSSSQGLLVGGKKKLRRRKLSRWALGIDSIRKGQKRLPVGKRFDFRESEPTGE